MKYKPTAFPVTEALAQSKEYGWAIATGILEFATAIGRSQQGLEYLSCGNPKCHVPIRLVKGQSYPKICSKCGTEIDWVGIRTKIIKVCPKCDQVGALGDFYCPYHAPAVAVCCLRVGCNSNIFRMQFSICLLIDL